MKALILAAGYATRLYPLTRHFPKPLLEVGGRTILDRLVDQIVAAAPEAELWLATNARFAGLFEEWARKRRGTPVQVVNDGTDGPEQRLGAIGDLQLLLRASGGADELLVAAADNIFEFDLAAFVQEARRAGGPWVCVHRVEDPARRRRTGIAELDAAGRVIGFEEKPAQPRSEWGVPPLYVLDPPTAGLVSKYLAEGGSPDAPGRFIEWLCPRAIVRAWKIVGHVHDIGTLESLAACRARFGDSGAGN